MHGEGRAFYHYCAKFLNVEWHLWASLPAAASHAVLDVHTFLLACQLSHDILLLLLLLLWALRMLLLSTLLLLPPPLLLLLLLLTTEVRKPSPNTS
jgi:hypothetical protein